jgi:hypothetical protein
MSNNVKAEESNLTDKFEFSGFARLVGGYLDTDEAEYLAYSDELKFGEQSLFALQSDFTASETLSASAQLLAHSSDLRESGLEWLYLRYEPNNNLRFTLGKLRTPFTRYSGTLDVGFAYPWISPPQQVYATFLFSNYNGVTAAYRFNAATVNFEIEALMGSYSGDFERQGGSINADIDKITGLIVSGDRGNFSFRASYLSSDEMDIDIPGLSQFANVLDMSGFNELGESLRFNKRAGGFQASINYDSLDYFAAFEWTKFDSSLLLVPNEESFYLTGGYNFYPFQAHATFASSQSALSLPSQQIPTGINEGLDQLALNYQAVVDGINKNQLDSFSVGLRWDFRYNMALKGEVTLLRGEEGETSFFSNISNPNFDRDATLYQFALEWVF